jgi:tetratricopeptide (TPR) repeat protein
MMAARKSAFVLMLLVLAGTTVLLTSNQCRLAGLEKAARNAVHAGRYGEARAPLASWLNVRPGSAEAHYLLAKVELAADHVQEALAETEKALALGHPREPLEVLHAVIQAEMGEGYEQAEPILHAALAASKAAEPKMAEALARIYLTTFQLGPAAWAIDRWMHDAPGDARPFLWRNLLDERTKSDNAVLIRNYRSALERDPNLDEARLGLANRLRKDRRFKEAKREFDAYLARKPSDASALVGAGRNALDNGDCNGAISLFERALAVNTREPDALRELALIDLRRGEPARARDRLQIVVEVNPYDPDAHFDYARALRLTGADKLSRVESELAVRLRKDLERTEELRTALVSNPRDTALRLEAAQWLLSHGHDAEGLNWTRAILRDQPFHVVTHRLLAEYHQHKGNTGLANYHRLFASQNTAENSRGASR